MRNPGTRVSSVVLERVFLMITLSPGSLCDVCAEEYGPHNLPHSIPCGHVLCLSCCNNILEKTPSRLSPACPFCRVQFTSDAVRLIRIDFGGSGYSTPRTPRSPRKPILEAHEADIGDDDVLLFNPGTLKTRAEARRLESKVAKVAAKKCSVEEVTTLHKELQDWLNSDKLDEQTSSLQLSAALLRAILVNHVAHSEATRIAKNVEANLRERLEESQNEKEKLEAELRSLRSQYSQKAQECQTLRAELNRAKIKSVAPSLGVPATPPPTTTPSGLTSPPRPSTTTGSRSGATSPTSPTRTSYAPSFTSPLARPAHPVHSRTTSLHVSNHRSMTPSVRSGTPAVSGADIARPATIPPKPRRMSMSTPTPTKMTRSSFSSDEKEKERQRSDDKQREKDERRVQLIQRWIPSIDALSRSPPTGRPEKFESSLSTPAVSRAMHPSMVPSRYKTPLSTHSP
ncbi:hypothetical protein FKP32DRAFT_693419 [Trametes sanguinea]|nr:hypothetical protein FKP32DRAFT_693419 [Trametes sanguinea]